MELFLLSIPLETTFRLHPGPQQWEIVDLRVKITVCGHWGFSETLILKCLDSKQSSKQNSLCDLVYTSRSLSGPQGS